MSWNLPDGCSDCDVDRAAPGYWDEPEVEERNRCHVMIVDCDASEAHECGKFMGDDDLSCEACLRDFEDQINLWGL